MKIMLEKLEKFKSIMIFLINEKFSYKSKNRLIFILRIIKEFPKLVKFIFKDVSQIGMIGSIISLDSSTMCQLKCPMCPSLEGIKEEGALGWGYLKFKNFKNFVDKNPEIKRIELSNSGEPFLNPELKEIIKYGWKNKVDITIGTGANLNSVKGDILESLVKYEVKSLTISLDGATNHTYKIYRIGGDFDKVIRNIKIINYFKKKHHSDYPKMLWQFVIMGHNEHEIPAARKFAKQLGMGFYTKLNRIPSYSPIKDKDFVRKESHLGVSNRKEFLGKYKRIYILGCLRLWNSPQINWDGKLLGCNVNLWNNFGNVFETSLKKCLQSERYIYTKQVVLGRKIVRDDIPCSKCAIYKRVKRIPIKKSEIILNDNIHTHNIIPMIRVQKGSPS